MSESSIQETISSVGCGTISAGWDWTPDKPGSTTTTEEIEEYDSEGRITKRTIRTTTPTHVTYPYVTYNTRPNYYTPTYTNPPQYTWTGPTC